MASGKFRDPIAERKAHDEANPPPKDDTPSANSEDEGNSEKKDSSEDEGNSDKKDSSEDDVIFDDLQKEWLKLPQPKWELIT